MKRQILLIISCLAVALSADLYGQVSKRFFIGAYCYDMDAPMQNGFVAVPNTDPIVGLDHEYLIEMKRYHFNTIITAALLYRENAADKIYVVDQYPLDFLDRIKALKLSSIIVASDQQIDKLNPIFNSSLDQDALNYYGNHPAVLGFHYLDEPGESQFQVMSQYRSSLEAFNSQFYFYNNLYPLGASEDQLANGIHLPGSPRASASLYEEYIENYIETVNPKFIPFDNYFVMNENNKYIYMNLQILNDKCNPQDIDFYSVLCPWKEYYFVSKTKSEYSLAMYAQLAYGAKGFAYWPREGKSRAYAWDNSSQTAKDFVKDLHGKLVNHGSVIANLELIGAYHYSDISVVNVLGYDDIPVQSQWHQQVNDPITSQFFDYSGGESTALISTPGNSMTSLYFTVLKDHRDNVFIWFVNKDPYQETEFDWNLSIPISILNVLDDVGCPVASSHQIHLNPGEGKLFQVNALTTPNYSECNKTHTTIKADRIHQNITIAGPGCEFLIDGGDLGYKAEQIDILENTFIEEGSVVDFVGVEVGCSTGGEKRLSQSDEKVDGFLFPNPSENYVVYRGPTDYTNYTILDISGKMLKTGIYGRHVQIHTGDLASGTYLIRFVNDVGKSEMFRFVKI